MIASAALPARNPLARLWAWGPAGLVVGVAAALVLFEPGDAVTTFATVFLGVFFEALPFLLVGVLVSAALQTFADPTLVRRFVPAGRLRGALAGALLGAALPVCECGVVPVARRLLDKGASLSAVLGFLLAGPVVNPIVFVATWTAFGLEFAGVRVLASLSVAVLVAWLYGLHPRPESVIRGDGHPPQHPPPPCAGERSHLPSPAHGAVGTQGPHGRLVGAGGGGYLSRLTATLDAAGGELLEMGRYLVLGAAAAAILRTAVPGPALVAAGQGPLLGVSLMMALAAILSICSVVDAFVALSLSGLVASGAMLAFLVFGPVVDVKSVLLYGSVFRWRSVGMIVLLLTQIVLLLGVAVAVNVG